MLVNRTQTTPAWTPKLVAFFPRGKEWVVVLFPMQLVAATGPIAVLKVDCEIGCQVLKHF